MHYFIRGVSGVHGDCVHRGGARPEAGRRGVRCRPPGASPKHSPEPVLHIFIDSLIGKANDFKQVEQCVLIALHCRLSAILIHANQRSPGKLAPRRSRIRKSKFIKSQIVATLKQAEGGRQVKDVCRELGISDGTCYAWKSKYGGMEASGVQWLRDVEATHAKLKRMYAGMAMENHVLKDLIANKL